MVPKHTSFLEMRVNIYNIEPHTSPTCCVHLLTLQIYVPIYIISVMFDNVETSYSLILRLLVMPTN